MKKFESVLSVAVISAGMIGNISAGDDQYAEAIELHCNQKDDVCNYGKVVEISFKCSGSEVD